MIIEVEKAIKKINLLDTYASLEYKSNQTHAESRGESLNGFIKRAINETIQRDNEK